MLGAARSIVASITVTGTFAAISFIAPSAQAQLRDPVPSEQITDGVSLGIAAGILGELDSERDDHLDGELTAVFAWTRGGVDETQGLRGPRWTNRWGGALEAHASAGSSDRPLVLTERSELALYAGSIGQTIAWGVQPRMTDAFWRRGTQRFTPGAFVDFPGIGLVKREGDDVVGCEGFPIFFSIAGDRDIRTIEFEYAVARVAGRFGDSRLIDHRITVRDHLGLKAIAWDFSAISARDVELTAGSSWRMSGALGLSVMTPFKPDTPDRFKQLASVIPLARIGIAHRGTVQLRATRSEIGRALVDDLDLGVELATLHRFVDDAGLDAGGQITAWGSHALTPAIAVRTESMLGVAKRRYHREMDTWASGGGAIWLARVELAIAAEIAHGFALEVRAAVEHSDRADPTSDPRWQTTLQSGLSWRHR